jgi:protein gp37
MWDWNAYNIPISDLETVIAKCRECPQHVFQILSKWPKGYARFNFPENVWLGTSITRNGEGYRVVDLVGACPGNVTFVSAEPILEPIRLPGWAKWGFDWLILGAETGHRKGRVRPKEVWIMDLIQDARAQQIPVYVKKNIVALFGAKFDIKQFPGLNLGRVPGGE